MSVMEEEIWWSCTLDKHEPEYSWPPEDYVKGLESNVKVQRLLIKNAILAPDAVKDEVVVVQIECEGLNNRKVISPIVAMKGGQDYQLCVDLPIPGPARLKIVAGQGPIHLTGSHCLDFNEQSESGDNEEGKEISDEVEEGKEDLRSKLEENLIENSKVKINEMEDLQTERKNEVCVKTEFEHVEVEELKEKENDIKEETESTKRSKEKLEIEDNMEIEEQIENEDLKVRMGDIADVGKVTSIENVCVEMPQSEVLEMYTVEINKRKKGKSFEDINFEQKTRENIEGGDKMVKTGNKPDLVHSYLEKLKTSTPIKSETEKGRFQVPEKRKGEQDKQAKAEKKEIYIKIEEITKMKRKSSHDFSSEKKKKAKTSFNNELNPEEVKIKNPKNEPIPVKKKSYKSPVQSKSLAHSKVNEASLEFENNPKAYQAVETQDLKGIHDQIPKSEEEPVSERGNLSEAIQGSSPGNNKGVKPHAKRSENNVKPSQMSKKSATVPNESRMIEDNQKPTTSVNKTSSTAEKKHFKTSDKITANDENCNTSFTAGENNFKTRDKVAANDENCKNPEKSGVSPGAKRAGVTIGKVSNR